jgi:uncharacterized protein (DUF433 family)
MPDGFSLKEAAAIAELPEEAVRMAIEKKAIAPSKKRVGKSSRYVFGIRDLFYVKLLSEFPLDLDQEDKIALRNLVFQRGDRSGRWRRANADFTLTHGLLSLKVDVRRLRDGLARDIAIYRRGRRRIVSDPEILVGEPVFAGTRIPLAHIVGLIAREDYPSLHPFDLAFAAIHAKMKRSPGRPRKTLEIRRTLNEAEAHRAPSAR